MRDYYELFVAGVEVCRPSLRLRLSYFEVLKRLSEAYSPRLQVGSVANDVNRFNVVVIAQDCKNSH